MEISIDDTVLRLAGATISGILIGFNRDVQKKPIGMRTLGLVSLGAAVVSVAAIQYGQLSEYPDPLSRVVQGIIQGVMAGISFIGAGVIFHDARRGSVEGLTTAATVWVAAALGVACGLAAWPTVAVGLALALLLLIGLGWAENRLGLTGTADRD